MKQLNHHNGSRHARGFSLIEVLVALIVIAVGMLGIAKLQALALSTTGSSGVRSLVAIEAASLAASMHTNRDYWVGGPPPASFTVSTAAGAATVSGALGTAPTCGFPSSAPSPCPKTSAAQIAAYDVQEWGAALASVVPASLSTITCNTATVPANCTIQIAWQENVSGTSNQTAATSSAAAMLNSPQYTLYVQP